MGLIFIFNKASTIAEEQGAQQECNTTVFVSIGGSILNVFFISHLENTK
jgi:hypothetical protein